MVYIALIALGLCLGSFVNALVWRIHQQEKRKNKELSILNGRSMCPHCKHELKAKDLIPVVSWLWLKGRCRYCGKPISVQYPIVELATAALFVLSYAFWPNEITGSEIIFFLFWLMLLTGFMALIVYDFKWLILPNRVIYPLLSLAGVQALLSLVASNNPKDRLIELAAGALIGGGLFYLLFQVSQGRWIGGGDVKLGFLLGIIVGGPFKALLMIFLASLLGSLASMPFFLSKRVKRSSQIPFGPFLIAGAVITRLFGGYIFDWYLNTFVPLS